MVLVGRFVKSGKTISSGKYWRSLGSGRFGRYGRVGRSEISRRQGLNKPAAQAAGADPSR